MGVVIWIFKIRGFGCGKDILSRIDTIGGLLYGKQPWGFTEHLGIHGTGCWSDLRSLA
jgi:hypothetical protein